VPRARTVKCCLHVVRANQTFGMSLDECVLEAVMFDRRKIQKRARGRG
jgi:hypothetical protein